MRSCLSLWWMWNHMTSPHTRPFGYVKAHIIYAQMHIAIKALPCHGIPSMTAASLSAGPESGSSSFRGVGKQTIQSSWMNDPDSSLKTYRLIVLKAMVTWGYHGMTAMTCYDYGNPPPGTGTHGCAWGPAARESKGRSLRKAPSSQQPAVTCSSQGSQG